MPAKGYAFNTTKQTFLATELRVADTHWARLVGLLGTGHKSFGAGKALWIVPCRGIHTLGMRYCIDVIYLDCSKHVIHVEENVRPWRVTPMRMDSDSVIELPSHTVWDTGTGVGDQIEIILNGTES